MGSSKKFKKKKQLARDAAPPINPATGHSKKVKKKKQVPSDAARISALETALARAERAERAARRALKNDNRQHESLTDSEEGEWQPFPRSNLPQAPPPATRPVSTSHQIPNKLTSIHPTN